MTRCSQAPEVVRGITLSTCQDDMQSQTTWLFSEQKRCSFTTAVGAFPTLSPIGLHERALNRLPDPILRATDNRSAFPGNDISVLSNRQALEVRRKRSLPYTDRDIVIM